MGRAEPFIYLHKLPNLATFTSLPLGSPRQYPNDFGTCSGYLSAAYFLLNTLLLKPAAPLLSLSELKSLKH